VSKGEAGLYVDYCAKDFLDGTQMLDPWEELAYRRICDMIYVTNDRLIDDDRKLAWATKTGRRWPAIKAALTGGEKPKLQVVDGRVTNARCQSALGRAAKKIAQKAIAGAASAASGKSLENLKQNRTDDRDSVRHAVATDHRTTQRTKEASKEEEMPNGILSGNGPRRLPDVAVEMTKIWNEECGSISRANKPNASRRGRCARAWRHEFGGNADQWRAYCRKVAASPHLRGENDRGWRVDLDWVLKPENLSHITEGRYERRASVSGSCAGPDEPAPSPEELWRHEYAGKVGMAH
jgi:uncharacterized protein YdaU (DUF1376 family)